MKCGIVLNIAPILLLQALKTNGFNDVPQPFRVIWNSNTKTCSRYNLTLDLDAYNIEANSDGEFIGDKIAQLYSNNFGSWPYIDKDNGDVWVNGGMPQHVEMSQHLHQFRNDLEPYLQNTTSGFGLISMELWRPDFVTNYASVFPYIPATNEEIQEQNPTFTYKQIRDESIKVWNSAARNLLENTLKAAKDAWPGMKWGYYGFPRLRGTASNDRVRAVHGNPDTPLMVYTRVISTDLGKLYGKWLEAAIKLPVEMGVDGLVIWASYSLFRSVPDCLAQRTYLRNTLGPFVKDLMYRMRECSEQMCEGHGRCVAKRFVDKIKYLRDRGVVNVADVDGDDETGSPRRAYRTFLKNYVCQCYSGWSGEACTRAT